MTLSLGQPWALLLLLVLPPLIKAWRQRPNAMSPQRKRAALTLRCLTLICLVLALGGANVVALTDSLTVLFVMDRSLSTGGDSQQWQRDFLAEALKTRREQDRYGIVVFGKESRIELPPGAHDRTTVEPFGVVVDRGASGLTSALRFAAAALPGDTANRLVVLSDGQSTESESRDEASTLAAAGIEVWTVPLPDSRVKDVLLSSLDGPSQIALDEPFVLRAVVESAGVQDAELLLSANGTPVERVKLKLRDGPNLFLFPQRLSRSGPVRYEARVVSPEDQRPENNKAETLLVIGDEQKVLVLRSQVGSGALVPMLRAAGINASAVTPAELPRRAGAWRDISALVIEDVSALDWPLPLQEVTSLLVRDGGMGLFMLGSDATFGVGGYQRTPIEALLPVNLAVRRPKDMPLAALVQCLDKSGSMSGRPIEMAREAAIAAAETLSERDLVGLIAFDESARWVVKLGEKGDGALFTKRVSSLRAGGGTDLYPGLKRSLDALEEANTSLKHIIVLSDGATAPADFDGLMARARENRVTVSAVALGSGADMLFLRDLTNKGKGRLYAAPETGSEALPQIFVREAILATGAGIVERPTEIRPSTQAAGSPLLSGLDFRSAPRLGAYNTASAKGGSALLLLQSPKGDPILATGRAGLGQTAAWTSDLGGVWAASWATHPGAGGSSLLETLMLRTVRSISVSGDLRERSRGNHLQAQALTLGDLSSVSLRLRTREPLDGPVKTVLVNSRGEATEAVLQPETPYLATGSVTVTEAGSSLVLAQDASGQILARSHLSVPLAPEFAKLGTDSELLKELAQRSGGRYDAPASELFAPPAQPLPVRTPLGHDLVRGAILLLLLEIAVRRLPSPRRTGRGVPKAATPATTSTLKEQMAARRQAQREAQQATHPTPAQQALKGASISVPPRPVSPPPAGESPAARPQPPPPAQTPSSDGAAPSTLSRLRAAKKRSLQRSDETPRDR